ncbi:hypothetical protein [Anaerotignum lactatifermentans]|uniref:hypothetical protein n=1 Tax=Anaerotignum lactatifermentans TaxID=160404 RepID=UPI00174BA65E|nr:hypothetical protein [Anaerotignum lactatifermentans]
MKLKLTDSPGIAGGFYWIYQKRKSSIIRRFPRTVKKLHFTLFSRTRKGLGNEAFPNWNPQSEFTSDEKKQEFQGFLADGIPALYFCLLVKGLNEMSL